MSFQEHGVSTVQFKFSSFIARFELTPLIRFQMATPNPPATNDINSSSFTVPSTRNNLLGAAAACVSGLALYGSYWFWNYRSLTKLSSPLIENALAPERYKVNVRFINLDGAPAPVDSLKPHFDSKHVI